MVPRVCSIISLSPYWGTLIPCLKEMGKDFLKFMVLVVIVYVGFLTTFSLVGREKYSFPHMAMIVTKIFFGSSYVGFDIMEDIDPIFGIHSSHAPSSIIPFLMPSLRSTSNAHLRHIEFHITYGISNRYAEQ